MLAVLRALSCGERAKQPRAIERGRHSEVLGSVSTRKAIRSRSGNDLGEWRPNQLIAIIFIGQMHRRRVGSPGAQGNYTFV